MTSGVNMYTNWILKSFTHDNVFQTVDLSGDIPADSTGVIVFVTHDTTGNRTIGVRKTGSSDSITRGLGTNDCTTLVVGVNGSREVDFSADNADTDFLIAGDIDSNGGINTNWVDVTPGTAGSWQTLNPTNITTSPTAAFYTVVHDGTSAATNVNVRKTGSSDSRTTNTDRNSTVSLQGGIIGLDGSGDLDAFFEHDPFRATLYYVGDINDGVTLFTNAVDKTQTTPTGSFTNLDLTGDTAADADGCFMEDHEGVGSDTIILWREDGSTDDFPAADGADIQENCMQCHIFGMTSGQVVEFYIEDASKGSFLLGYTSPIAAAGASLIYEKRKSPVLAR